MHPSFPGRDGSAARLLAAALAVFNEVGINAASIHDICRRAHVSIGSAYHHFGSKQGLADALLVDGLRENARARPGPSGLRAGGWRDRSVQESVRATGS